MHTHLFAAVAGQIEDEYREEGYAHTGNNEINRVKEGLPSHGDVEGDVEVGLVAARIKLFVPVYKRNRRGGTHKANTRRDAISEKERLALQLRGWTFVGPGKCTVFQRGK